MQRKNKGYIGIIALGILALASVLFFNTPKETTNVGGGSGTITPLGSRSPLTTKGDLYTYSTTNARLPVGTNGKILSANSATATGLEWINAPSGGTWGSITGTLSNQTDLQGALDALVPYTGATADVVLGTHHLDYYNTGVAGVTSGVRWYDTTGTTLQGEIEAISDNLIFKTSAGKTQSFNYNGLTLDNVYSLPDTTGTLALLNSTGLGTVTVDNLALAMNTVTGTLGLNFINSANDLYKFRSFTNSGIDAIFDVSLVATSDKTYTLQNASGTLAFLSDITAPTLTSTYIGVGDGSNLLSGSSAFTYASGRITNTATTEQLRLAYNSTNYLSNTISSNGSTSYSITSSSGTPTFTFNKETVTDLGTIPYVGQYVNRITAVDAIFGGTYDLITNFGYNYTTQYWSAQSRNPGIIEFDGGTQSFSFRSGNGGYTDIFGYNKLDLRTLAGQNVRIMNGATVNIQVTGAGNVELQDSVKLLTYGSGTHSGTSAYTLQVDSSGNVIEGVPSRLKGYTVAGLPSGVQGDTAFVTNALAPVYGNTVVGGGAVVTPVFYNGANWIVD